MCSSNVSSRGSLCATCSSIGRKSLRFSLHLHVTGKGLYARMFEGEETITDPGSQLDGCGVTHLFGKLNVLAKRAFPDFKNFQDSIARFSFIEI